MTNRTTRRLRGLLSAVTALALTATGCDMTGPYEPTPPNVADEAAQVLQSLPSLEETQRQVQAAVEDIKAAVGRIIPGVTWRSNTDASGLRTQCAKPYDQSKGGYFTLPNEIAASVQISESQWSQIEQAATAAAAKLEASEIQVMRNEPGFHDVGFHGPGGLSIKVGYHGNLVVSGDTGCRLPDTEK